MTAERQVFDEVSDLKAISESIRDRLSKLATTDVLMRRRIDQAHEQACRTDHAAEALQNAIKRINK